MFAMLVKWLCLLTPLGEPCHMVQRKLGLALEAAGQVHADYPAAVHRQRAVYNGARQWKDLESWFDTDGQRCTTSPPFPATEATAVTDTLLAGIRERQGTIDPRDVLECVVLLDHGHWLALPAVDRATFGVDVLKQFVGTHNAELAAAHVNAARA